MKLTLAGSWLLIWSLLFNFNASLIRGVFASAMDDSRLKSALAALSKGQFSKSRLILKELTDENPKKGLYWFNLGNVDFKSKRYSDAIKSYRMVISLNSPLSPVARIYIARSLRLSKKPIEALNELRLIDSKGLPPGIASELKEEISDNQNQCLAIGLQYFDELELEKSLPYFDQVIKSKPENPKILEHATVMKGIALFKLERGNEASEVLSRLSRSGTTPALRENSRILVQALKDPDFYGQFPWWAFLDVSMGLNSNVYGVSADDGASESFYHRTLMSAGSRFFKRGEYTASGSLGLGLDQFYAESDARAIQANLGASLTLENPRTWKNISPFVLFEMYGDDPFVYRPGLSMGMGSKKKDSEVGINYSFVQKIPAQVAFEYFGGAVHELKVFHALTLPGELITTNVLVGREGSADLVVGSGSIPLARTYLVPGVSWRKVTQESKDRQWEFNSSLAYQFSFFDQGRQDRQWILSGSVSRWLESSIKAYGELTLTQNSSTMNEFSVVNKNFTQWMVTAGISWDIHQ